MTLRCLRALKFSCVFVQNVRKSIAISTCILSAWAQQTYVHTEEFFELIKTYLRNDLKLGDCFYWGACQFHQGRTPTYMSSSEENRQAVREKHFFFSKSSNFMITRAYSSSRRPEAKWVMRIEINNWKLSLLLNNESKIDPRKLFGWFSGSKTFFGSAILFICSFDSCLTSLQ